MLKATENCPNLHSGIKSLSWMGFSRKMYASNELYGGLFKPKQLSLGEVSLGELEHFPPHLLRLIARDKFLFDLSLVAFLALGSILPLDPGPAS